MSIAVNTSISGLTTLAVGIPTAGATPISGKLTVPTITTGSTAQSSVIVTVSQTPNGGSPTVIYTSRAGDEGFALIAQCAALDTITIALTSSNPVDQQPNAIRTTISVG